MKSASADERTAANNIAVNLTQAHAWSSCLERLPRRMLCKVIDDKTASGDNFLVFGPDELERSLDKPGSHALSAQLSWRFGVGDHDRTWHKAVVRESDSSIDMQLEALERGVVEDRVARTLS